MPPTPLRLSLPLPRHYRARKAVLVGVRYTVLANQQPRSKYTLTSTYSDVEHLHEFLTETMDFPREDITVLKDDVDPQDARYPNRANLLKAMEDLVSDVRPGDHLVFHFSGHGSQIPDENGDEKDGMDEAIWPADVVPGQGLYDANNVILDDTIKEMLVDKIPAGAHLVIILDCCHSGSGADLQHCHKDHFSEQVHEEILHPLPATRISVQKIGLKGITGDRVKKDTTSPIFANVNGGPTINILSPLTPATADAFSPDSDSPSSTPASSLFEWSSSAASTPSSATSFESMEELPLYRTPKHPVVISWAACQDPDTTLSLANSGGYFVKAFVEAFRKSLVLLLRTST
ncbi:uncharacterized protein PHACADRAFT_252184 [Phanerochaete carnosa HHB-10118-sp]|uniref:Peptidase C14 caspase domain-containing protein n=1 Tax=Phanerochaete carnosa (strain HHB-10118-sp) TaxID=650164 RepID=K5WFP0_PHACS|nr:uncharacterized protein PHACADRAFT_252184 [Phanerochaete carnosa HHB-10118-sp]EKM58125.1 hypothetical protein PHACADRAFT_252184 [Phanerochaete carnosa HHB-10118-sp]